jgi:anti-sigma B factor antagonist
MEIHTRVCKGNLILEPAGRVTAETAEEFTRFVSRLIESGATRLVLDLGHVPYIDSMGLGVIMHAYTSVRRRGGNLELLNVTGRNRRLLEITKLLDVFRVHESEEAMDRQLWDRSASAWEDRPHGG